MEVIVVKKGETCSLNPTDEKSVLRSAPPLGHIDHLINPAAVWRICRRGNKVGWSGQYKGKTDSRCSIKQRANKKCVRDGCAVSYKCQKHHFPGSEIATELARWDVVTEACSAELRRKRDTLYSTCACFNNESVAS